MLFIHPMWLHESQRIGKQKCTPIGYALHVAADLLGFFGLLFLFGSSAYLTYRAIMGLFDTALFWLLVPPLALGVVSEVLYRFSWWLALRKGYHFDYDTCEATWTDAGRPFSYKWNSGET
jgi:hypothetical protein